MAKEELEAAAREAKINLMWDPREFISSYNDAKIEYTPDGIYKVHREGKTHVVEDPSEVIEIITKDASQIKTPITESATELADAKTEYVSMLNDTADEIRREIEARVEPEYEVDEIAPSIKFNVKEITQEEITPISKAILPDGVDFTQLAIAAGAPVIIKTITASANEGNKERKSYFISTPEGYYCFDEVEKGEFRAIPYHDEEEAVNSEMSSLQAQIENLYVVEKTEDTEVIEEAKDVTEVEEKEIETEEESDLEKNSMANIVVSYFEGKADMQVREDKLIMKANGKVAVLHGNEEEGIAIVLFKAKNSEIQDSVLSHDYNETLDYLEDSFGLKEGK